ncbi:hypothetical protein CCACVL1_23955 [Corchorus capsularis]|uniref:Uncharacterized protein n=1 Tax=Corchorus capsularis TaxID=210143 RepID=A0A1R3GRJ0_COCAP|nr:hypothetical protein CCACVL1_23955 [Corchorus capsularis]
MAAPLHNHSSAKQQSQKQE